MHRRSFLAASGVGLLGALAGCGSRGEFEPDVEPTRRLGGAEPVSMAVTAERPPGVGEDETFEGEATERAADEAASRLRSILGDESLLGTGVNVGVSVVDLAELDQPTEAEPARPDEFRWGKEIGPRVFHFHHYARDGELLSQPSVSFEALVEATPRSFEVSLSYPERSYAAVLPAICRRGAIRNS